MTEQELDALDEWLAREMMGWRLAQEVDEVADEPYFRGEWIERREDDWWSTGYINFCREGWPLWRPTRNASQVVDVLLPRLAERRILLYLCDQLGYDDDGENVIDGLFRAGFVDADAHDRDAPREEIWFGPAQAETLPLAVCLAAQTAVREQKIEESEND
jgi:hypothetical protein